VATDRELVQIVDAAMSAAVRKSGSWIACRPGCTQCCIGPFPITILDAARLRSGLDELGRSDPQRAAAVRRRSAEYVARLTRISDDPAEDALSGDFADEWPCPALDPDAGTCDLYAARPLTCRTFGPAVSLGGEALGVCELCYHGATEQQIAACRVDADPGNLEDVLLAGDGRQTIVALALCE
jgi:Fe-S-cluster containining protein